MPVTQPIPFRPTRGVEKNGFFTDEQIFAIRQRVLRQYGEVTPETLRLFFENERERLMRRPMGPQRVLSLENLVTAYDIASPGPYDEDRAFIEMVHNARARRRTRGAGKSFEELNKEVTKAYAKFKGTKTEWLKQNGALLREFDAARRKREAEIHKASLKKREEARKRREAVMLQAEKEAFSDTEDFD